jgi:hypothetical protein
MICVMPDETEIDIPDAWRYAVHPRRLGMAALASAAPAGDAVGGKELEAERERILAHSGTDPALAALARSGEPQPFVQAGREVYLTEDPSSYWQRTVEAAALNALDPGI